MAKRVWYPAKVPFAGADGLVSKEWDQYFRQLPQFTWQEAPTGTIDGSNATFTLAEEPNPTASLHVWTRAAAGTSWALQRIASISGKSFTLSAAPAPGSVIACDYTSITLQPPK